MWIMLFPNLLSAIMQLLAVLHHWEMYKAMEVAANREVHLEDYGADNVDAYTHALFGKSVAAVYLGVKYVTFIIQSVLVGFAFVAFLANAIALYRWDAYHFSRYMLLVGWLGMFLAPFFVSLVPSKNFLRWQDWELNDERVDEIYSLEAMGFRGGIDYVYDKEALKAKLENLRLLTELAVGMLNSLVVVSIACSTCKSNRIFATQPLTSACCLTVCPSLSAITCLLPLKRATISSLALCLRALHWDLPWFVQVKWSRSSCQKAPSHL
jgi:hypothetical protein